MKGFLTMSPLSYSLTPEFFSLTGSIKRFEACRLSSGTRETGGRPIEDMNFPAPINSYRPGKKCWGYVALINGNRNKVFQMSDG